MPVYEYRCSKCEKVFEKMQKFADEPLTTHPDCGGPVERLISAPGLHFKGSGWYITDYARSGSGPKKDKSESKSGESGSKSESKSDAKSESKSETKSESKPASTTSKSD
jgi:putative FmdB family regulatory protein